MERETSFGPMQSTPEHLQQLRQLRHSPYELDRSGYILADLSPSELQRKRRCGKCYKLFNNNNRRRGAWKPPLRATPGAASDDKPQQGEVQSHSPPPDNPEIGLEKRFGQLQIDVSGNKSDDRAKDPRKDWICKFHPGQVRNRIWSCCNGIPWSTPCHGLEQHTVRRYKPGELEEDWRYHRTRTISLHIPAAAVVIDCEMGTSSKGESELIRLSMVDFFTGATLIDSLVYPSTPMMNYNTRYSGVSNQDMEAARRSRRCIFGRDAARSAVYNFVDLETIIIGHACNGDLTSLRMIHDNIVDTLLIEKRRCGIQQPALTAADATGAAAAASDSQLSRRGPENEEKQGPSEAESREKATSPNEAQPKKGFSLKALTLEKFDRVIQVKGRGHDSLEDALATRDLLWWYMTNPPPSAADGTKKTSVGSDIDPVCAWAST